MGFAVRLRADAESGEQRHSSMRCRWTGRGDRLSVLDLVAIVGDPFRLASETSAERTRLNECRPIEVLVEECMRRVYATARIHGSSMRSAGSFRGVARELRLRSSRP
ncbi:hypothetical protein MRX96_016190 [Rhipicephalus microplus]